MPSEMALIEDVGISIKIEALGPIVFKQSEQMQTKGFNHSSTGLLRLI